MSNQIDRSFPTKSTAVFPTKSTAVEEHSNQIDRRILGHSNQIDRSQNPIPTKSTAEFWGC
jgi:hypothetical protein